MNKSKHYMIQLNDLGDERGGLCVIENLNQFPFEIKRVFYDFNTDDTMIRGKHANQNSSFGMVSIKGTCTVTVDDGQSRTEYTLNSPFKFLIIEKMVWKEMAHFSSDNVLLIVSDHVYDSSEYIYDYSTFLNISR